MQPGYLPLQAVITPLSSKQSILQIGQLQDDTLTRSDEVMTKPGLLISQDSAPIRFFTSRNSEMKRKDDRKARMGQSSPMKFASLTERQ